MPSYSTQQRMPCCSAQRESDALRMEREGSGKEAKGSLHAPAALTAIWPVCAVAVCSRYVSVSFAGWLM